MLYPLIPYLSNERLNFRILLLEVQDFKLLSNDKRDRKRKASRFERIPTALIEDRSFANPEDFRALLPDTLPEVFTVKQFSAATKIRGRDAYSAVRVLSALHILKPSEPIGRAMAFQILPPTHQS